MEFIITIIIIVVVYKITWNNFFSWKTVVKYLWKNILKEINYIAEEYVKENNEFSKNLIKEKFEESIKLKGGVVNSILKYVNYHKKKNAEMNGDEYEKEKFQYGYFDFDKLLAEAIFLAEETNKNQKGSTD